VDAEPIDSLCQTLATVAKEPDSRKAPAFGTGLLPLLAPGIGYLYAYQYKSGATGLFGVPSYLVQVNTEDVIVATAALILVFSLIAVISLTYQPLSKSSYFDAHLQLSVLIVGGYLLAKFLIYGTHWSFYLPQSLLIAYWPLFELIWALVTQRKVKGLKNKFNASQEYERATLPSLGHSLFERIGRHYALLAVIFFLGIFLSSDLGKASSLEREAFLMSEDSQIVVERIGDSVVLAPYDRKKRQLETQFTIRPLDGLTLSLKELGPLRIDRNLKQEPIF
jgi:hypothetical protein